MFLKEGKEDLVDADGNIYTGYYYYYPASQKFWAGKNPYDANKNGKKQLFRKGIKVRNKRKRINK